ncbi:MAG: hypothetical protein AAB605_01535 [Patescibacteria group bacterium]
MELSIFLAKLFGLYFLIAGGIIMMRQKSYMHIMMDVLGDKGLLMIVAACQLIAGLALVISHWIWTPNWQGVITLIGVWIAIEGVFYLAAPYTKVVKIVKMFNTPTWYTSGGLLSVVLGAYLAGKGFGLW